MTTKTDHGMYFQFAAPRATGAPGEYVTQTYRVGPLTPDEVLHVEVCEECGAARDTILSGIDMGKCRAI